VVCKRKIFVYNFLIWSLPCSVCDAFSKQYVKIPFILKAYVNRKE